MYAVMRALQVRFLRHAETSGEDRPALPERYR